MVVVIGDAACAAIPALEHNASSASTICQRVSSRDMLIDSNQNAAGFDQDLRRLPHSETQIVCRSSTDNSNHIDTGRNRYGDFGADRTLDNLLHGSRDWLRALIFMDNSSGGLTTLRRYAHRIRSSACTVAARSNFPAKQPT